MLEILEADITVEGKLLRQVQGVLRRGGPQREAIELLLESGLHSWEEAADIVVGMDDTVVEESASEGFKGKLLTVVTPIVTIAKLPGRLVRRVLGG